MSDRRETETPRRIALECSCAFCAEAAIAECRWPVEKFMPGRYSELVVGDRVRRAIDRLQRRAPATVAYIAKAPVGMQVVLRIRGREKEIVVLPDSRVQVARMRPCGTAVCESHLRSVADGFEYCRDHWHAWEAAA